MSETTSRFKLPYIMPGQAQKHVTHNEALRSVDALLHVSVISRNKNTPPIAPNEGESYLIGDMPTEEFSDHSLKLAGFVDDAWMFYPPEQGLIVNIEDEDICVIYRGSEWIEFGSGNKLDGIDILGINAGADNVNRLALNSEASLFNHNGHGHQLKINKSQENATASVLFQNGFSGRAEMGLAGNDDFAVKVSADGVSFKQAMQVDGESGRVNFPNTPQLAQPVIFNMFGDGGRFGGKPEPLDVRLNVGFAAPDYIRSFNGSTLLQGDKYIDNSNNYGGNRGVMPAHLEDLVGRFKPGASTAVLRYGTEFYTLSITAGMGAGGALVLDGVTVYLAIGGLRFPIPARYTLSFWVRATAGSLVVGNHSQSRVLIDGIEIDDNTALTTNGNWHHIERVVSYVPSQFVGYEANPYRIYAEPNSEFQLAAPVLFPGTLATDADQPTGIVNALTAFM